MEVSIKTRSPPASLSFKGQATKQATVKWSIKLFGCISGDIILFVSSKQRRLEARNFAVILFFIPFTTNEKPSVT